MNPIVLASASPRRRALLEALGIDLEVVTSGAAEVLDGDPREVVLFNAIAKRDEVAGRALKSAVIVGADTIVVIDDTILGKPDNHDAARAMLSMLSGKTHSVLTGVAIVDTESGRIAEGVEETRVTFRELNAKEIDRFVDTVNPLDRAGAYTVDGPGTLLVARYDGCYQNVLGLPMVRLDTLFRQIGDGLFDRIRAEHARFL